jgi:putative SOS response-associated peptidase YedK
MCGRFVRTTPVKVLASLFDCPPPAFDLPPNYNTAPTQSVAVVRFGADASRELVALRWGLLPSWATDDRTSLVNARADSVATKPSFRTAFKKRRCLMPADGYYEWRKEGKLKQPYLFRRRDNKPFAFAALWEIWTKGAEPVQSCALITTDANEMASTVHDRMPVILAEGDYARWLDPDIRQRFITTLALLVSL